MKIEKTFPPPRSASTSSRRQRATKPGAAGKRSPRPPKPPTWRSAVFLIAVFAVVEPALGAASFLDIGGWRGLTITAAVLLGLTATVMLTYITTRPGESAGRSGGLGGVAFMFLIGSFVLSGLACSHLVLEARGQQVTGVVSDIESSTSKGETSYTCQLQTDSTYPTDLGSVGCDESTGYGDHIAVVVDPGHLAGPEKPGSLRRTWLFTSLAVLLTAAATALSVLGIRVANRDARAADRSGLPAQQQAQS